jgi:DNA-binding transcriptional LysR family regulator
MPVDIAQLRTLFWIARLGSFRAAAARLNVSQPTISLRIKSWEQELGFPLFKRAGRSVALSDDGAAVLEYAERVIALLDNLDHRVASQGGVGGFLQLGAPDSFALLCLADLLSDLEARHPKLRVSVTVDNSAVLFRRLDDGALDVCVLAEPPDTRRVRLDPLGRHQLVWVARAGALPRQDVYGRAEIAQLRIFSNPSPSNTFTLLMDWFAEEALVPGRMSTCNSVAAILSLVASGAGISPLPRAVVGEAIERGALDAIPVVPALPDARIFVCSARSSTNPAVPLVAEAIKRVMKRRPFLD